jgi:hypothetical protein
MGIEPEHIYPAREDNAYSPETIRRLADLKPGALFVLDLGVMDQELAPGAATLFIDHHRPYGRPKDAVVLSSYGQDPSPPTTYMTYDLLSRVPILEAMPRGAKPQEVPEAARSAEPRGATGKTESQEAASVEDLAWLCAVGTTGDLGSDFKLEHAECAASSFKKQDVTEAEILINSAKRASAYDIATPVRLLDEAAALGDLVRQESPLVATLERYRQEVNEEVKRCRHEGPQFLWRVAVIPFKSRCDIQGLIAETWRRQLKKYFVIAANFGYLEGKVAYVVRTELDSSVIELMESLKPPDYPGHIVFGHDRAGSGVVPVDVWQAIATRMGFRDKV